MAVLKSRLRQIEIKLKLQLDVRKEEPQYIYLLDLPKETVIEAFAVLKEATGGNQCLLSAAQRTTATQEELEDLDLLSPEQCYDLLLDQRMRHREEQASE